MFANRFHCRLRISSPGRPISLFKLLVVQDDTQHPREGGSLSASAMAAFNPEARVIIKANVASLVVFEAGNDPIDSEDETIPDFMIGLLVIQARLQNPML